MRKLTSGRRLTVLRSSAIRTIQQGPHDPHHPRRRRIRRRLPPDHVAHQQRILQFQQLRKRLLIFR